MKQVLMFRSSVSVLVCAVQQWSCMMFCVAVVATATLGQHYGIPYINMYLTPLQILDDLYPAHGAHKIFFAGQIGPANFLAILVQQKNNVCPLGMLELFLNDETVQGNIYLSGLKSGRWES